MLRISLVAAIVALCGATAGMAQDKAGERETLMAEIGKKFRRSCMHCHLAPDLRFATDRAWLDQIHRTA